MFKNNPMSLILKELSVKNFKCFKKEQTLKIKPLTILTGANSSGKSSVLHAILGSIQSGGFPYKFSPNGKFVKLGDFGEIANKHTAKEIGISLSFVHSMVNIEYTLSTTWSNNHKNSLPELKSFRFFCDFFSLYVRNDNGWLLDFFYDPAKDATSNPEEEEKMRQSLLKRLIESNSFKKLTKIQAEKEIAKQNKYISSAFRKAIIKNFKISSIDSLKEEAEKKQNMNLNFAIDGILSRICRDYDSFINLISSFRLHPDRTYLEQSRDKLKVDKFGDGYLDQILSWENSNPSKIKELVGIMKELELIHTIHGDRLKGGRYDVVVTTTEKGTETSIMDVGFGISQFLPIIVADLQLPDQSTLMIAEPEIHLHPTVQAKFADYLVKQIKDKKKNYIIETHSEYLLNRLRLAIVKEEFNSENLAVYFLENDGLDVKVNDIRFGKQGEIEGAPESFFKTYMMDVMDIALNA